MLTEFHKNNIRKLVDFIPTIPEDQFTCQKVIVNPFTQSIGFITAHTIVLDKNRDFNKFRNKNGIVNYNKWSTYFFGLNFLLLDKEWDYLFSIKWVVFHNTKEAALARVKTFIANDFNMPEKWSFDSPNLDGSIE